MDSIPRMQTFLSIVKLFVEIAFRHIDDKQRNTTSASLVARDYRNYDWVYDFMTWTTNYININLWDVITHPCHYLS